MEREPIDKVPAPFIFNLHVNTQVFLDKAKLIAYHGNMTTYDDTDYPEKVFTSDDATINTADGACPFQATGYIDGQPFYFRLRHGSASLDVGYIYTDSISVSNSEHGYLDGACSYEEFLSIFTELLAGYSPEKRPVEGPENAQYSYDDATIDDYVNRSLCRIRGSIVDTTTWSDYTTDFVLDIYGGQASLELDNGYYRQMNVDTNEYDYASSSLPDDKVEEVFNILIADYR